MKCTIGFAVLFLLSFIETASTANKTVTICPGSGVGAECPSGLTHECQRDNDCPQDKTCCLDYCYFKCVEPVKKPTPDPKTALPANKTEPVKKPTPDPNLYSSLKTVTVCEHLRRAISCPVGSTIDITYANYGRTSRSICQAYSMKTTNCRARSSISKVRSYCQNKRQCNLYSSNFVFGDPCVGTNKYLRVLYRCRRVETALPANKTVTICPGSGVGDKCPDNPANECQRDNDCPRGKTCCLDYCSLKCVENALMPDKREKGDCPNRALEEPLEISLSGNKTCHKDSECPGKQKCCRDMGNTQCTDTFSLTYTKKVCPRLGWAFECPPEDEIEHECKLDRDCPANKICCKDYCYLTCVDPKVIRVQKDSNDVPVIKGKRVAYLNMFTQRTLKLTCVVTAKSKFEVTWYDSKASLHPDLVHVKYRSRDGRKIVSQLRIPNVTCENYGEYICMARTDRQYAEVLFHVKVYDRRTGYMCPQSELFKFL